MQLRQSNNVHMLRQSYAARSTHMPRAVRAFARTAVAAIALALFCFPALVNAQGIFRYKYSINNAGEGINSSSNDYAPVLSRDGNFFYFTSYRNDLTVGEADIYSASRLGETWSRIINPGAPLNSEDNEGSIAFLGEGEGIVFAADGRDESVGTTDLYLGMLSDGRVASIRNLGEGVNSDDWDSQPSLNGDGSVLYFASDRPGGFGGTDIWLVRAISEQQDGTPIWGDPENLGPSINTAGDERSPCITLDGGTLYFASDGHPGFGEYDIFVSYSTLGDWSKPENLGSAINSSHSEMFFFAPGPDRPFYFTSDRDGGLGNLDIYSGTPNVFGNGLCHITINVTDSSDRPIPGIVIITDIETADTVATIITSIGQLDYEQQLPAGREYQVSAEVKGRDSRTVMIEPARANETRRVRLLFSTFTTEEFDLATYTVPFFVNGYYQPNTSANLEQIFPLREKKLKEATYIDEFSYGSRKHRQYRAFARVVDKVMETIYSKGLDGVFPRFLRDAPNDDILEIRVTGYADPEPFVGTYYDDERARFTDRNGNEHTVSRGAAITNLELSGLRAWHTAQYLDRLFMLGAKNGKPAYQQLKEAGRIRMRVIGAGTPEGEGTTESQRRLGIEIVRTGGAEEFDLNTTTFK